MKRFVGLCLVLALVFALAAPVFAQEKPAKQPERVRYSGNVVQVNKDNSSFTIQSGTNRFQIFYTPKTVYTNRNQPGAKLEDLKEGKRVIVLTDPAITDRITATRVDFRTEK